MKISQYDKPQVISNPPMLIIEITISILIKLPYNNRIIIYSIYEMQLIEN